jgi:hypothetical protein
MQDNDEESCMIAAVLPTGNRQSILHDLTRRRDKAMDLLYAAEAAGDERRFRRATERFWLRELQIDAVEKRSAGDICPRCEWGEDGWPAQALLDYSDYSACLEHDTERLERQASEMAQQARWLGRR